MNIYLHGSGLLATKIRSHFLGWEERILDGNIENFNEGIHLLCSTSDYSIRFIEHLEKINNSKIKVIDFSGAFKTKALNGDNSWNYGLFLKKDWRGDKPFNAIPGCISTLSITTLLPLVKWEFNKKQFNIVAICGQSARGNKYLERRETGIRPTFVSRHSHQEEIETYLNPIPVDINLIPLIGEHIRGITTVISLNEIIKTNTIKRFFEDYPNIKVFYNETSLLDVLEKKEIHISVIPNKNGTTIISHIDNIEFTLAQGFLILKRIIENSHSRRE